MGCEAGQERRARRAVNGARGGPGGGSRDRWSGQAGESNVIDRGMGSGQAGAGVGCEAGQER